MLFWQPRFRAERTRKQRYDCAKWQNHTNQGILRINRPHISTANIICLTTENVHAIEWIDGTFEIPRLIDDDTYVKSIHQNQCWMNVVVCFLPSSGLKSIWLYYSYVVSEATAIFFSIYHSQIKWTLIFLIWKIKKIHCSGEGVFVVCLFFSSVVLLYFLCCAGNSMYYSSIKTI